MKNLEVIKSTLAEARRLGKSIVAEYNTQLEPYTAAMKRKEFETVKPDLFLERFRSFWRFQEYVGNVIAPTAHILPRSRTAFAVNIEKKYIPSIEALLKEIKDHPERIKLGEEEMATRIQADLALAIENAKELTALLISTQTPKRTRESKER